MAAVVPVSALKGDGLKAILAEVGKVLPEGDVLFDAEELSDKPVRFFVGEFVREQILRRTRPEIPHGVAVTVELGSVDENLRKLVRIGGDHPRREKDSHKGIMIGDGGKMLSAVGTAARRLRAEDLLDPQGPPRDVFRPRHPGLVRRRRPPRSTWRLRRRGAREEACRQAPPRAQGTRHELPHRQTKKKASSRSSEDPERDLA